MLSAKQYLIGLVQAQTQTYLNEIDVVFSDPVKLVHGSSRNTHIKVFPQRWIPLSNGIDIYYNRVHVSRIRPFKIKSNGVKTVHQLLDVINATQEFNFTTDDLVDSALPVVDSEGFVVFKPVFKPTSLGFYDGPVVKTVTEYIEPFASLPPEPIDPNDIPIAPYPPVSPGTLLRTECRNNDQWGYYARYDLPPEWSLRTAQSLDCMGYRVDPVTTEIKATEGDKVIVTYFFNKLSDKPVTFRPRILTSAANVASVSGLQYKLNNTENWVLVNTAAGLTIPANTQFFSLQVALRDTMTGNIFVRLVEKGAEDNYLLNGQGGIDVQINVTGTSQTPPPLYEPYGLLINEFCSNNSNWGKYHDGVGGTYDKIITADDPNCGFVAKPVMTVDQPVVSLLEDAEHIFVYTLNESVPSALGLKVSVIPITATLADVDALEYQLEGTATWTAVPSNGVLSIPQSHVTFSLRLKLNADTLSEGNEYMQLVVEETSTNRKLSSETVIVNITIIDLQPPPPNPTAVLSAPSGVISFGETQGGSVRFNISESINYNVPLLFKLIYQTAQDSDVALIEYRAGGLGEYTPIGHNQTLYLVAGALFLDFKITLVEDLVVEGSERFRLSLEEPVVNTYLANTTPVTKGVTILDDSIPPP